MPVLVEVCCTVPVKDRSAIPFVLVNEFSQKKIKRHEPRSNLRPFFAFLVSWFVGWLLNPLNERTSITINGPELQPSLLS
jgi:hypothetical protein